MTHRAQCLVRHLCPVPAADNIIPASLDGKVAIVTGSGQGIGFSVAMQLAELGAKVVVSDLDEKKASAAVAEIQAMGGAAICINGDVTKDDYAKRLIDGTLSKWGRVDVIVNNAGYTWDGVIHRMSDAQWEGIINCHATAPFKIIRAAAAYMREAGKEEIKQHGAPADRCIINISSTSGLHGNVGQINYATAKSGVLGLTKTVAKEWGGFGIRCNAVAFGLIATRMTKAKETNTETGQTGDGKQVKMGIPAAQLAALEKAIPLRRSGLPEEAAAAVVFLCTPKAAYITGHCLEVTGGTGI